MTAFEIPRDDKGEVIPHDHPLFGDGQRLIRRICDDHIVEDKNLGRNRLSSALFKNDPRNGYLSIDSEKCILDLDEAPCDYVTTPKWFGALIMDVSDFRSFDSAASADLQWKIGMVPLNDNECHGGVWGKITPGQSKSLQRKSDWLVEIDGVAKLNESEAG